MDILPKMSISSKLFRNLTKWGKTETKDKIKFISQRKRTKRHRKLYHIERVIKNSQLKFLNEISTDLILFWTGDFPDIDVKVINGTAGETLSTSVTELVKGVPSGKYYVLYLASKPSPMLPVEANAGQVGIN